MEQNTESNEEQEQIIVDERLVSTKIEELEPDNEVEMLESFNQTSIAGFWRRWFAFIIDGLIVSIPLFILGFGIRDIAFSLGPWGRIIGYIIIIPYWGYFNSEKHSGQTLGKQVMKIVVVNKDNQYLSLGKSFSRAFVLGLIFMLNGWALPILQNPILAFLVAIIVFGGTFALIYGIVFNRTTRQGIHDLIVGTYVIDAPPNLNTEMPRIPKIHQRITYGLLGIGLLIGIAGLIVQQNQLAINVLETGEMEQIEELHSILMENDEFFSVDVHRVNRGSVGSSAILKDLNIEVWIKTSCNSDPDYCQDLMNQIAITAFEEYDNIENLSGMKISIANRFDFGLASGNYTRGAAWSIEDWQKELEN